MIQHVFPVSDQEFLPQSFKLGLTDPKLLLKIACDRAVSFFQRADGVSHIAFDNAARNEQQSIQLFRIEVQRSDPLTDRIQLCRASARLRQIYAL